MIKLLSTDFDGTLVNHFHEPPVSPAFFELLRGLQEQGALWAINTGRGLAHIIEGLEQFGFSRQPDFVLTNERDVYRRRGDGTWEDYGDWNSRCLQAHDALFASAGTLLQRISAFLPEHTEAQEIYEEGRMVGVIAKTDEEMDRVVEFLDAARRDLPLFCFQRNTIYLRFCHAEYSKGAALGELGRLEGITREEIFAAGDHHNDLSMLDGRFARWVACPTNSIDAVKEAVRGANGYVARGLCSDGVVEALRFFFSVAQLEKDAPCCSTVP